MKDSDNNDWWPPQWPDWPQDPNARLVVGGLFEIGMLILNAPASRRQARLAQAEDRAQRNLGLAPVSARQKAKDLVSIWQANALIQFRIRWLRNKDGLETIKHMRPQWYTAEFKMRKAEEQAVRLGASAYEYFMSEMEYFLISQEEKDEKGSYHGLPDFSELRRQWYAREQITVPLPWAWDQMLQVCQQYAPNHLEVRRSRSDAIKFGINTLLALVGTTLTIFFGLECTQ